MYKHIHKYVKYTYMYEAHLQFFSWGQAQVAGIASLNASAAEFVPPAPDMLAMSEVGQGFRGVT